MEVVGAAGEVSEWLTRGGPWVSTSADSSEGGTWVATSGLGRAGRRCGSSQITFVEENLSVHRRREQLRPAGPSGVHLVRMGHPEPVAQGHILAVPGEPQGWRHLSLSGQPNLSTQRATKVDPYCHQKR